ncbi:unnamed protein product [Pedinophyceae sp. YPF-701]|nr:unnamed protein product [Pedinophyceae sp. YPF-701]
MVVSFGSFLCVEYANSALKKATSEPSDLSPETIAKIRQAAYSCAALILMSLMVTHSPWGLSVRYPAKHLLLVAFVQPPAGGVFAALLLALHFDGIVRNAAALAKFAVVLWPPQHASDGLHATAVTRRAHVLTVVERAHTLHRSALPLVVWAPLLWSHSRVFGRALAAVYVASKACSVASHVADVFRAVAAMRKSAAQARMPAGAEGAARAPGVGRWASQLELCALQSSSDRNRTADGPAVACCAICHVEMEVGEAVVLEPVCAHIFHERCVVEWFKRGTTCPICREPVPWAAKAGQDEDLVGLNRDGRIRLPIIA